MKLSWPVLVCTALSLSVGMAEGPDEEVARLKRRVAELEERVSDLERVVIRIVSQQAAANQQSTAKAPRAPEKPVEAAPKKWRKHDYFLAGAQASSAERVRGIPWLRKVAGLKYARPRNLSLQASLRVEEVLRSLVRTGSKPIAKPPFDTLALGFRAGDHVLSVNGVRLDATPDPRLLHNRLYKERHLAVLTERKGALLVLSYSLAAPMVRWRDWPSPLDVGSRYALVMASVALQGADRNTVILHDRATRRSLTLEVGDQFDGCRVQSISMRGQGDDREAEVTLWTPEGKTVIRLFRRKNHGG